MFNEQKQSQRKVLKVKALIAAEGQAPASARTVDIGMNGMAVMAVDPIPVGANVQLRFDLFVDGALAPVEVRGKANYCILSHGDFKIGLTFVNLGLPAMTTLGKYLR